MEANTSPSSTSICLSKQELKQLTGKTQFAAQNRALAKMGIQHVNRPDGSPVVMRQALEKLLGVVRKKKYSQPDFSSLL